MKSFKNLFLKYKRELLLIFLILTLAAYLRLEGVFTYSFPFTYDIGRDLLSARDISTLTKIPLIGATTGLQGLFYGPWWYYLLGILYIPLQGDPALFTGFIALTGVLTAMLGFVLGKKIDGTFLGIVFTLLLSFSPVVMSLTSQIWNPTLIPILWIVTMFNLMLIFENSKKLIYFLSLGILLTLIVDMEIVVGLLFGAGVFVSLLLAKPKVITIKSFLTLILGSTIILLPRIIFDIRHENILSNALFSGLQEMLLGGSPNSGELQIVHKLKVIFNYWNETIALGNPVFGSVILILTILFIVKNFKKGSILSKYFLTIVVGSTLVTIVGVLVFGHDIWPHYLVALPLLFVLLVSLGLNSLYKTKGYKITAIILSIIIIVLNINPLEKISNYKRPLWEGDAAVYRNQLFAVDYVYEEAGNKKFKYIVYTPPVFDYTYRYLFTWHGERKYKRVPESENAKYLFVVIEPDYQHPLRINEWLEVRKNDGKILKEEKLKGGIIVQKREL